MGVTDGKKIELIAALSKNHIIGRGQCIPWHLPEDLAHFRELTLGQAVIMGRLTFESLGCKPLAERLNIVITSRRKLPRVSVAHSLAEALNLAKKSERIMIIGGERVFNAALPLASRLHLTRIMCHMEGDTAFPDWSGYPFAKMQESEIAYSADNLFEYRFETWERFALPAALSPG